MSEEVQTRRSEIINGTFGEIWQEYLPFRDYLKDANIVPTHVAELPQGPQPMSVQIVARRWREDLAVDASAAIEARLGRMCDLLWQRMG